MSAPDTPLPTDAQRIITKLDELVAQSNQQNEAINGLGSSVQWIVDNVNGLFQMFGSPQFMSMLPQMMSQFSTGVLPDDGSEGPPGPEFAADGTGPGE